MRCSAQGSHNYYHTIVDNLPRVLALDRLPIDQFSEISLLCPGGATDLEAFFLDRFGLGNVRPIALEQGVLYELERLIFTPFKSGIFSGYLPDRYVRSFRDKLFPKPAEQAKSTDLYIKRARCQAGTEYR